MYFQVWSCTNKHDVRIKQKFFSSKERQIIKTTFRTTGKATITRQEIRDAIDSDTTFAKMFKELLLSKQDGKQITSDRAEIAIQSSYRSQFRDNPINEDDLFIGHLNI